MSTVASLPIRYTVSINPDAFTSAETAQERGRIEAAILLELRQAREVLRDEVIRAIEARGQNEGDASA